MADVLILAIETATGCGGVSLTKGGMDAGKVLAEYTLQPEVTHSRRLLGSVGAMMEAAGVAWADLDGVAVSLGPGSFTGLRIGMAAAKGIGMGANLPLLGVPTLDGLAAQATPTDLPLCCLLDARKQQVYAAFYCCEAGRWRRTSDYFAASAEQLAQSIHEPTLLVGPGIMAGQAVFAQHPLARMAPSTLLHPRAAFIGFVGASMLAQGHGNDDLVPLYVRASEAELNLRQQ